MTIRSRPYDHLQDFNRVGNFLVENFKPGNMEVNWLQPAWEYMLNHPSLDWSVLDKIRLWEDEGKLAGVANYESRLGEAFFQLHPDYPHLRGAMLDYAEMNLAETSQPGHHSLRVYINDFDQGFMKMVSSRDYQKDPVEDRPMAQFTFPDPFPEIKLPSGFQLNSLEEDNDLRKIHRVLWRGFNHEGEPPEEGIQERLQSQSTPNFRKDLTMVVQDPHGDFVSYCGIWLDPKCRYCYVEPVATDPNFRRLGFGKAAILEGLRRCSRLGISCAFVWNDLEIYASIGFKVTHTSQCWKKVF